MRMAITATITRGHLEIRWSFSTNRYRQATIERLADEYLKALRSLLPQSNTPKAVNLTAQDFPEAQLSQSDLEKLLARLSGNSK